jgi:glutaredoxin
MEQDAKRGAKKKSRMLLIGGSAVIAGMIVIIGLAVYASSRPGPYDTLAKCLTRKGYTFYGASWCPHCKDQKALFDKSIKHVNYVECAVQGGDGITALCKSKGVKNLPTWITPKGKKLVGVQDLGDLAEMSACPIPGNNS